MDLLTFSSRIFELLIPIQQTSAPHIVAELKTNFHMSMNNKARNVFPHFILEILPWTCTQCQLQTIKPIYNFQKMRGPELFIHPNNMRTSNLLGFVKVNHNKKMCLCFNKVHLCQANPLLLALVPIVFWGMPS